MSPRSRGRQATLDPTRYTPCFSRRAGRVWCEEVPLERIAARVGTPAYVYSKTSILRAHRGFDAAFRSLPHTLCYAVKANSNLSVLRLFAALGSSFDIVSGGELHRPRSIVVPGRRIVFSGVGKRPEEIREALRTGILMLNVESEAELELVAREAARLGRAAPAAIRINPDVAAGGHPHISTGHHLHKFGVDWNDARRLYRAWKDSRWIEWRGISVHIGSQILSLTPFERAVRSLATHVRELSRDGIRLRYFDFGGGIGIRYWKEEPLTIREYARAVTAAVRPLGCHLLLEPGRVLVGPAGVLLTRVLYTKRSRGKNFVIVDAGMNDFMRPALYGVIHPITKAHSGNVGALLAAPHGKADIVGPVCETSDCFLHDWRVEDVQSSDLLILWGTCAYGFVSATNYNSRCRPPEILVEGHRFRVIRRRESFRDLIRAE